jgi:hypothetical protein
MNLIELWRQEFHSGTAALTGAAASVAIPVVDILTRIGIGIAVGVGTWIVTKTIAALLNKFRKNKCDL